LTIPGVEGVERFVVGRYTDERVKRLAYLRRNDLTSVAKVRASDLAKLLQGPAVYRDRTIVDVLPSRFEQIVLSAASTLTDGRLEVTLRRDGSAWNMAEPVSAPVREDQVDKLLEVLGGLRAKQVVGEEGELSAYGLHAPAVTLSLTYKPPVEYRIEPKEEVGSGDVEAAGAQDSDSRVPEPAEVQPPSRTIELMAAEHDGKHYAKRTDAPAIYEVTGDLYKQLLAEYRTDRILDFDGSKVSELSIRHDAETHVFRKREDRWTYDAEPDLPLDTSKVENLVLQVRDLRTPRYVAHVAAELAGYGLSDPAHEVSIMLEDGTSHVLRVSDQVGDAGSERGHFATVQDVMGVFLLAPDSVLRFKVSLDELEKDR
jgi:hypothetical protein